MSKKSTIQKQSQAPLSPFDFMRSQMNAMFQEGWPKWPSWSQEGQALSGNFVPSVETSESRNKVKVSVELPGLAKEDVKLSLAPDGEVLVLSGEKKFEEESKDEENNFYHFERSYGSFRRNVPLPCAVDVAKVKAKFKDGVLKVTMHKLEPNGQSEPHHIQIET